MSRLIKAAKSAYTAIEEPFPEVHSLHRTIKQLKETVEIMAGQRGREGSLVAGISLLEDRLTTAAGTFSARIEETNTVFVTDMEALAQQILLLEAQMTVGSDFVETLAWQFNNTDDGWTASGATLAPQLTALRVTPTGTAGRLISPVISLPGNENPIIQYTIIRKGGTDWNGKLYYKTADHDFGAGYYKQLPEPGMTLDTPQTFTVDMDVLDAGGTDYTTKTITGLRFDFGVDAADVFDVDRIAVGTTSSASLRAQFREERTARVTADEALVQQLTTLTATVNTNESDIEAKLSVEQTARSTADGALAQQITTLTATVSTNNTNTLAALQTEQTTRANQDTALAQQITTLGATVTTNKQTSDARFTSVETAYAAADTAIVTSVTNLTASLFKEATTIDASKTWSFARGTKGWVASGGTITQVSGAIRITPTGTDPIISITGLTINGGQNPLVQFRVTRRGGTATSFDGKIFYGTAGHGHTGSFYKQFTTPGFSLAIGESRVFTVDMSALTAGGADWINATITSIRIDIGAAVTDLFDINYVSVGAYGAAEYVAAVETEQFARVQGDQALAGTISTLSSTVTTNKQTTDAAIVTEANTRATQDTAIAGTVTTLTARVSDATAQFRSKTRVTASDTGAVATYRWMLSTVEGGTEYDIGMRAGIRNGAGYIGFLADRFWLRDGTTEKRVFDYNNGKFRITGDIVVDGNVIEDGAVGPNKVNFNYARSTNKGGNADDTDKVGGRNAGTVRDEAIGGQWARNRFDILGDGTPRLFSHIDHHYSIVNRENGTLRQLWDIRDRADNGAVARTFFDVNGAMPGSRIHDATIGRSKVINGEISQIAIGHGNPDVYVAIIAKSFSRLIVQAFYTGDGTNIVSGTNAHENAQSSVLYVDQYPPQGGVFNVTYGRLSSKIKSVNFGSQTFTHEIGGGSCAHHAGANTDEYHVFRAWQNSGQQGRITLIIFELTR